MHHFNPLATVTGRHAYTLFEIRYVPTSRSKVYLVLCLVALLTVRAATRLDNDFIVFRGNEHESSGQLVKGTVVLCLPASLRVDDVHLRLVGTERLK